MKTGRPWSETAKPEKKNLFRHPDLLPLDRPGLSGVSTPQPPFGWGNDARNKEFLTCKSTSYASCFLRGRIIVSLPSPYQSVLRVNDLSDPPKTTLGQDSRRGIGFRKRVCSGHAHL